MSNYVIMHPEGVPTRPEYYGTPQQFHHESFDILLYVCTLYIDSIVSIVSTVLIMLIVPIGHSLPFVVQ